jgi:ATP-binding cassette subfamily G (WHITE) protein 2 (SNQ2)
LFQQFERILLLGNHGQPCYFGNIGSNAETLISYFERNGGRVCGPAENPAEYMLETIGNGNNPLAAQNWADTWMKSPENANLLKDIDEIHHKRLAEASNEKLDKQKHAQKHDSEFAMPCKPPFATIYSILNMGSILMTKQSLISSGMFLGGSFNNTGGLPTTYGTNLV